MKTLKDFDDKISLYRKVVGLYDFTRMKQKEAEERVMEMEEYGEVLFWIKRAEYIANMLDDPKAEEEDSEDEED